MTTITREMVETMRNVMAANPGYVEQMDGSMFVEIIDATLALIDRSERAECQLREARAERDEAKRLLEVAYNAGYMGG